MIYYSRLYPRNNIRSFAFSTYLLLLLFKIIASFLKAKDFVRIRLENVRINPRGAILNFIMLIYLFRRDNWWYWAINCMYYLKSFFHNKSETGYL